MYLFLVNLIPKIFLLQLLILLQQVCKLLIGINERNKIQNNIIVQKYFHPYPLYRSSDKQLEINHILKLYTYIRVICINSANEDGAFYFIVCINAQLNVPMFTESECSLRRSV